MIFIGVVAIKDPLRAGVTKAVADCRKAGVIVRMVTGDNLSTAKALATECGIYTDGIIMEGRQFRNMSLHQTSEVIPRLQVLARATPEDKRVLVNCLKRRGHIVAVTGDGTNDGPALKAADVGFSMGIAGTEVARDASSIILMDDNFTSIVKAIAWGRSVSDAVKKFLQVVLEVVIADPSVSNHHQHHCDRIRLRVVCRQQRRSICVNTNTVTLGQFATRHLGGSGSSHGSTQFRVAEPETRTKGILLNFLQHVEIDS
jgi:hypothetical protein